MEDRAASDGMDEFMGGEAAANTMEAPALTRHTSRIAEIALFGVLLYLAVTAATLIAAHAAAVAEPASCHAQDLCVANRLVYPVRVALTFLDVHWRSALIVMLAPVVLPNVRRLLGRLTKLWGAEFVPDLKVSESMPKQQPANRRKEKLT